MITLSDETLAEGLAYLAAQDADLARLIEQFGPPKLRQQPPGFATLLQIILGQQVSPLGRCRNVRQTLRCNRTAPTRRLPGNRRRISTLDRIQPPEGPIRTRPGHRARREAARSRPVGLQ